MAAGASTRSAATVLTRSTPVGLHIPAIGVRTKLTRVGSGADGTVHLPHTPDIAGWFDGGPAPGEAGSAVLLGHRDSHRGPGVFFHLHRLRPGDILEIARADGTAARFMVHGVATYPTSAFPADLVYGPHGGSSLQLVSCGGVNRHSHHNDSHVVVYAGFAGTA
ncbi:MAG: class F sortase [Mycobacteriaceae bacterium]|nr:class F sortase [Mycobacteriaceae bacterium]